MSKEGEEEESFKVTKWKIELVNSFFGKDPGKEGMDNHEKEIAVVSVVNKENHDIMKVTETVHGGFGHDNQEATSLKDDVEKGALFSSKEESTDGSEKLGLKTSNIESSNTSLDGNKDYLEMGVGFTSVDDNTEFITSIDNDDCRIVAADTGNDEESSEVIIAVRGDKMKPVVIDINESEGRDGGCSDSKCCLPSEEIVDNQEVTNSADDSVKEAFVAFKQESIECVVSGYEPSNLEFSKPTLVDKNVDFQRGLGSTFIIGKKDEDSDTILEEKSKMIVDVQGGDDTFVKQDSAEGLAISRVDVDQGTIEGLSVAKDVCGIAKAKDYEKCNAVRIVVTGDEIGTESNIYESVGRDDGYSDSKCGLPTDIDDDSVVESLITLLLDTVLFRTVDVGTDPHVTEDSGQTVVRVQGDDGQYEKEPCLKNSESGDYNVEKTSDAHDASDKISDEPVGIIRSTATVYAYEEKIKKVGIVDIEDSDESEDDGSVCDINLEAEANLVVENMLTLVLNSVAFRIDAVRTDQSVNNEGGSLVLKALEGQGESKTNKTLITSLDKDGCQVEKSSKVSEISIVESGPPITIDGVTGLGNTSNKKDKIDASEVQFACLDIRLKTGFPVKSVKVKNCLSIILVVYSEKRFKVENFNLIERIGSFGCETGGVKFYSQSRIVDNQLRKDLVFKSENEARKAQKIVEEIGLTFLLTESELGYGSDPVLSETEMMNIISNKTDVGNIMKFFDGRVDKNGEGIYFRFSSLASLNLFIFNVAGPDKSSLGLLRDSLRDKKRMILVPSYRSCDPRYQRDRRRGQMVFKLIVQHSGHKDWKDLDMVALACNFELLKIGSGPSRKKELVFKTKIDLFEFWTGFTGRVLSEARVLDLNLKGELEHKDSSRITRRPDNSNIIARSSNDHIHEPHGINFAEYNVDVAEAPNIVTNKSQDDCGVMESVLGSKSSDYAAIINQNEVQRKDKVELDEKIASGVRNVIRDKDGAVLDVKVEEATEVTKLKIELNLKSVELVELKKNLGEKTQELEFMANRVIEVENELKIQMEAIASLEERLVQERKSKLELEVKLSPQEMQRRIDQRTIEIQESNLANLDWKAYDYFNQGVPLERNTSGKKDKLYLGLSNTNHQIRWSSILGLSFKSENKNGTNYYHCIADFLKSIASSMSSVFMKGGDVILSLKSASQLKKALMKYVDEVSLGSRLDDLKPRVRMVQDLFKEYSLEVFYDEHNLESQSREDLKRELSMAGIVNAKKSSSLRSVKATFKSLIAFVRALTNSKLVKYHRVVPHKSCFEYIGGNGENNYFKGQVCLTESNLMSIHYIGEQEHGFAKSFSKFLQDSRIQKIDKGRNGKLLVIFYNLKALEDCLLHSCQFNCNTLAKLVHLPLRAMLISRMSYFSLLYPPTAAKKDFACYKDICKLEEEPERISSKCKIKLVEVLRDVKDKYPDVHFMENNFIMKTGRGQHESESQQNEAVDANEAFEEHPLEEVADLVGVEGEATSDYEESIFSETTVGVGGGEARH